MSETRQKDALVGATAKWTAAVRAKEREREDRLFDDPWAADLAGEEGKAWIEQRPADSTVPIALRTRYFDDWLRRVTGEAGLKQVVLMAAGLDTRAFRLKWPAGTCLFELDQGAVLNYKEEILGGKGARANCNRRLVRVDLSSAWQRALVQEGFNPQQPSTWLLEGFLFYLPSETVQRILQEVSELAAPGSRIGFDIINHEVLTSPYTRAWLEMQAQAGAPWIGTLDDPERFLAERGWQAILSAAGAEDANHGRWKLPVLPLRMPNMPHNWFVTAEKTATT